VRPPQEVRVLVLDGSGVAMAAAVQANQLRGLGYAIAGTGDVPAQSGTTVACRNDFSAEAEALAISLGSTSKVVPFPDAPPATVRSAGLGAESADCIVTLGT